MSDEDTTYISESNKYANLLSYDGGEEFFQTVLGGIAKLSDSEGENESIRSNSSTEDDELSSDELSSSDEECPCASKSEDESPLIEYDSDSEKKKKSHKGGDIEKNEVYESSPLIEGSYEGSEEENDKSPLIENDESSSLISGSEDVLKTIDLSPLVKVDIESQVVTGIKNQLLDNFSEKPEVEGAFEDTFEDDSPLIERDGDSDSELEKVTKILGGMLQTL
jgi:hypothetical protein